MNPDKSPALGDANAEISTLIATLHEAGQRLEELTGGEVDSVVDLSGRTFLFKGVQEQLRRVEDAKQAAILNALPAQIALLDSRGRITSVNEAWRRSAGTNLLHGPEHPIGANYLMICDGARGDGASEARQAAAGIRSVLEGAEKSFSLEYPCHSPTEQRWFLMMVTPLGEDHSNGAVVMHLDITQRRRSEEALLRFSSAMDAIPDAVFLIDRASMRFVHVNDAACRFQNQTREEMLALEPWALFGTSREQLERDYDALIASGVAAQPLEIPRRHIDGSQIWVELRRHAQCSGGRWTIVSLVRDITRRKTLDDDLKESEARFRSLTEMSSDFYWESDAGHRLTTRGSANRKLSTVSTFERGTQIGERRWEIPHLSPDEAGWQAHRAELDAHHPFREFALSRLGSDGSERHISISGDPVFDASGAFKGYRGVGTDITGRKTAEAKIIRLNRVYAVLTGINSAIVRIRERDELFRETCRIAVSEGGFFLARVIEFDSNGRARIAATSESDSRLFQRIVDEHNSTPEHTGMLAAAQRDGQPLISNDVAADPRIPNRAALTEKGNYALALLPFFVDKKVAGAILLRAQQLDMFDEAELRLLLDFVSNLSFALEHMEKEAKVRKLTRVYAVLSGINTLIVRVRDRDELFREACRIAVEEGGFLAAWIGFVDPALKRIVPVAAAGGDAKLMNALKEHVYLTDDLPVGNNVAARAIREKRAIVSNDSQNDPEVAFRKQHFEFGIRSIAVLPLISSDEALGALALYSAEGGFFDPEEKSLLTELAGDIAFAIDHIDKQERLDYLAYYDALTGLANRSLFLERVAQYMRTAASGGHKLALFLIDLERFKNINDSLGRPAGDALLTQVAEWLTRIAGDASLVARVGADHFAAVLPVVRADGGVARFLEKTMDAFLQHAFRLNDAVFRIGIKVGVAQFPEDGEDADTLFRHAEAALKKAKASGDRYLFYTQKMTDAVAGKLTLENQLRLALDREEFVLHYQPKVNIATGKLTSAEALIRWNDPRTGLVPPGRFIPILEETGLIYDVGRWALKKAIADYLRWRVAGLPAVRIAVNVSAQIGRAHV